MNFWPSLSEKHIFFKLEFFFQDFIFPRKFLITDFAEDHEYKYSIKLYGDVCKPQAM